MAPVVALATFLGLVVSHVVGLTLNTPSNWQSSSTNNISWTSTSGDPSQFSLELVPPANSINGQLAVLNIVNTSDGSAAVNLPSVPAGDGYTIEAVAISNITDVLATTSTFSIAPAPVVTTSTSSVTTTQTAPVTGETSTTSPGTSTTTSSASAQTTTTGSAPNGASSIAHSAGLLNGVVAAVVVILGIGLA